MAYAEAEKALATRAAYASDWPRLRRLVRLQGRHSPASAPGRHRRRLPLLARRRSGRKASTIGRRRAAITHRHKLAGHEPPTGSEVVKAVLRAEIRPAAVFAVGF